MVLLPAAHPWCCRAVRCHPAALPDLSPGNRLPPGCGEHLRPFCRSTSMALQCSSPKERLCSAVRHSVSPLLAVDCKLSCGTETVCQPQRQLPRRWQSLGMWLWSLQTPTEGGEVLLHLSQDVMGGGHVSKAKGRGEPNGTGKRREEGGEGLGRETVDDGKGGGRWDKPAHTLSFPREGSIGY